MLEKPSCAFLQLYNFKGIEETGINCGNKELSKQEVGMSTKDQTVMRQVPNPPGVKQEVAVSTGIQRQSWQTRESSVS